MCDHDVTGKLPYKQHWGDMPNDYQQPEQQKQPLASVIHIQKRYENDKNEDEIESSLVSFGEEAAISVCLTSQSERLTVSRLTGGHDLDSNYLLNRNNQIPKRKRVLGRMTNIAKNRNFIVDLLAIFFGIGTWLGVNGTFIQVPLLVKEAPESWSLASYLSVAVQIGNIGPITYTLIQHFSKKRISDALFIYILLVLGTLSALFTSFFYDKTVMIFGEERSLALYILTFVSALTACTSSVLFMPYMGRFKEMYLVTYFVGEGLSGLLPSIVSLIQGIGGDAECILVNTTTSGEEIFEKVNAPARFSPTDYFLFIFVTFLCSVIAFILLDRLKLAKREYAAGQIDFGNSYKYEEKNATNTNDAVANDASENQEQSTHISSTEYVVLLLLIGCLSFMANGMFNSIQSYSSMPYGSSAYHLSVTLSVIANPVACFLAIFLPHTSLRPIYVLCSLCAFLTAYVFITACMSPLPPLHDTAIGSTLVIITWTLLIGLVSYTKLSISSIMRAQGGRSLVWTGGLTQIGALLGSVLIFILINFTNSFKEPTASEC
ncbi:solute carrier family 52, riboflavin transporter, member 3-A [Bactrocera tryoni]|uniref:solute carrier family 52, riboflavin transporter, member 3-A n=1 Tax=Bactrocera tryoni TaxID=59916 RepID=UPI001A9672E2|nr:solute carrier family 52, riboflavin transporter, member 3-A [Bactrocera tryoni]XP_039971036.1 solute carrier family 52, riboflavin transporter, member 3-A [Bactrocera tryoni]XP_039971037.1 solute carrier family 52, riboflavin transporter, member 3-A [Bactrocera tryoni]XP_039971038.1 solute carrier family 52, riboflavin transporter, member 3-A [Bactrocera tryoni]XP_039971040.1 solute carrier family 52, riboflavin transporter, member 3-A [Bactrocera tryoni]XP_039971041.1 solute carrier famil